MTDAERLQTMIEAVAASGLSCLICGGEPDRVAAFIPTDRRYLRALGVAPGRMRFLFYTLCRRCAAELYADPERFEPGIVMAFVAAQAAMN